MDDKKIEALARKNAAKALRALKKPKPAFDATIDATRPSDAPEGSEADRIFREMKRREF